MAKTHGNLSINSENIFPIIKKWLYSDHDIFFRELISNGCDAITKLKKLDMMGEYALPEDFKAKISVVVNPEKKTLTFTDNGIGMTADEVEEYINQIAFSGAADFLEKYKDKTNEDQIIGHFGLGFYSSFMVADEVHIDSLSWQEGAKAVHWECDGGTEFVMEEQEGRTEVGTTVTLFLNEDCLEFCNEYKAREVIKKYCSFMNTEIYLSKQDTTDTQTIEAAEKLDTDTVVEEIKPEKEEDGLKYKIIKRPELLNETNPLWMRHPNECEKEDYLTFYRTVFQDYKEPLFWIHLNMDYPFNLKGILYFPKINMEYESIEGVIKLYNNQVFIADNIKEVIPEFLLLLKGVIDCPDLPLNVSRSALQNDGFVKKIADYISKKVADKLSGMCKTEKEEYEKYWDDISPFIKYGCLRDDKFCEKMNDYILFKNLDGKYLTLPECLEVKKSDPDEAEGGSADAADGDTVTNEGAETGASADGSGEVVSTSDDGDTVADAASANDSSASDEGDSVADDASASNTSANGEDDVAADSASASAEGDSAAEDASAQPEVVEAEIVDEDGEPIDDFDDEFDEADETDGENAKNEKIIYYVTDEIRQSQYVKMFKAAKMDAVILTHNIDQPFVTQLESKNEGIKFQRIDADLTDSFKAKTSKKAEKEMEEQTEEIAKIMKKVLKKDKITVKVEKLKNKKISSVITLSEESRRMQDMMKMYSMPGMDMGMFGKEGETLTLNANHPLVEHVLDNMKGTHVNMICEQLYDLALLQHAPLDAEAMSKFVARSNDIMLLLAK